MMRLDFTGKRVFVADSATGLGRRVAEEFHALGAAVAVNGATAQAVDQAINEMGGGKRLVAAPGALTSVAMVREVVPRAIDALGGLDILVNSGGSADLCPVDKITESYFQNHVAADVKGAFFTAQACQPALKRTKGAVVNVASVLGAVGGPPGSSVFSATQGGIIQMTRMMALELARDGIRVNTLCHGLHEYVAAECPLKRAGTADDCVGGILYLAGPNAAFTTGSMLTVDGGLSSGF
jgi:NAD(P)-dependent dehydrogenase (short-subunit alcohol dehydrogenase family)